MSRTSLQGKVLKAMRENGSLRNLQAYYMSITAKEVSESHINLLKPYRSFRENKAYLLANQIVLQYLSSMGMKYSNDSAVVESKGLMKNEETAPEDLQIENKGLWLNNLLRVWNPIKDDAVKHNREELLKHIDALVNGKEKADTPVVPQQNPPNTNHDFSMSEEEEEEEERHDTDIDIEKSGISNWDDSVSDNQRQETADERETTSVPENVDKDKEESESEVIDLDSNSDD